MNLLVSGSLLGLPTAFWMATLLEVAFKGSLLLVTALLVERLIPRSAPAVRSRGWTLLFLLLLASSILSPAIRFLDREGDLTPLTSARFGFSLIQSIPAPDLPAVADGSNAGTSTPATSMQMSTMTSTVRSGAVSSERGEFEPTFGGPILHFASVIAVVWLAGAAVLLIRTILAYGAGRRLARSALLLTGGEAPALVATIGAQLGLTRPVMVRASDAVTVPFVTRDPRPVLVLPATVKDWSADALRAVVLHELAHLRRRDLIRLLLVDVVCAMTWFNPLVWMAARSARLAAEMACDELACAEGGTAGKLDYARRLLWFARRAVAARVPAQEPGMAGRPGLERRIRHILENGSDDLDHAGHGIGHRMRRPLMTVAAPALVVLLLVPLVAFETSPGAPVAGSPTGIVDLLPVAATKPQGPPHSMPGNDLAPVEAGIHTLAIAGETAQVLALIDEDPVLLNTSDRQGMTPLALAAWHDRLELLEALIARGADLDHKNHNGLTPLFSALDRGRHTAARMLLAGGADVQARGYRNRTLLHMAVRGHYTWFAGELVNRGVDLNAPDSRGVRPLDLATWNGDQDIVELLSANGAQRSGLSEPIRIPRNAKIHS